MIPLFHGPLAPTSRPTPRSNGWRHLLATSLALAACGDAVPSWGAEHVLNGHRFALPDGFTVELAAPNSLIPRPVSGSFDDQGRLYVTDSSGSNLPPAEQLKDPKSRILRLEDSDGDGRFDTTRVFADKVMFPQGCLWHGGSVYVAGPPSIWKFTDTDGDGRADQRSEWYQGSILTGCANDVHGPYLGPEGMLYWTKGAFGRLDLKDHRGRRIQDRCAHIFRAWPDGSGLESVMSGGMDNPVEVAFTAQGEPIVISTFIDLSQPGRRDGLGHAVYGGVFGKQNDVVDEPVVRRTGDLMPTMTHFGPAAACALTRYQGDGFGPGYRDNLFATLFNLRKVTRHELKSAGASFTTVDSDFLVSDQSDFHPTDVLQDVDGSLLVIDTGGWYKLCCPSSQLAKSDVLGAVYRVRRTGAPRLPHADRQAAYARWIAPPALDEGSPETVLKRAALAAKPASAPEFRRTLSQHAPLASSAASSARLARIAAEGLGRVQDRASVGVLFDAIAETSAAQSGPDRFLEHSLLFALIEIGDREAARTRLRSDNPAVRRAALLVLEQSGDSSPVLVGDVIPFLSAPAGVIREVGFWVARRHPEWSADLASHLRARLTATDVTASERAPWESAFDLLASSSEGQSLLADAVTSSGFSDSTRIAALRAMGVSGTKTLPPGWREAVLAGLEVRGDDAPPNRAAFDAALRAARSLPFPKPGDPAVTARLRQAAANAMLDPGLRREALAALPPGSSLDATEFAILLEALSPARPPGERLSAATAIQRLQLNDGQRLRLVPALATAGPVELPRLIAAFGSAEGADLGRRFVAALRDSKALRSLRTEDIKPAVASFPREIQAAALEILSTAQTDASLNRERLDALLAEVGGLTGEIRRGQAIFNSPKAACSSCHRIGYLGGDLGPDLTSIGSSRTERDLLESVLYPSASFVRSYEPWIASTTDGEEHSGVLRRDTPDEIVLATGPGAEAWVPRSRVADLRLGSVSTMPAGLDEQLTKQELADLLAFLKNTRWGAN
ncbi:MAG: PVC-type heme-binding CxxCH protein [Limisphaerales bacterium]